MERTLPDKLLNSLSAIKGFDKAAFENIHYHPRQITSVRFNHDKNRRFYGSSNIIHPHFNLEEPVPWCEYGFYLNERPQFTLDPLLHAGAYYVQEPCSMFLWEALQQIFQRNDNIRILDLCAAPGGKSTLIASYFKNALIVSNEVIKARANILYENIVKWGAENVVITNNDASDFKRLRNYFDLIVVDAPCSGSGLFRKDEDSIEEWSENNVVLCSQRQQRILADVYNALKWDGYLIYSTCSYSEEENEGVTDWMKDQFNMQSLQLKLEDTWNIIETQSPKHKAFGYRFWPHKLKGEGFFITVLRKKDELPYSRQNTMAMVQPGHKEISLLQPYLAKNDWIFFKQHEIIRAIHKQWQNDVAVLQKNLYLKKAGIQLGEIKGKDLVPHHELALSTLFSEGIVKTELDETQALQYLRKKDVSLQSAYKGWVLCTHKKFPLGWIKILHNRVNNYYPTEWRIRKE